MLRRAFRRDSVARSKPNPVFVGSGWLPAGRSVVELAAIMRCADSKIAGKRDRRTRLAGPDWLPGTHLFLRL